MAVSLEELKNAFSRFKEALAEEKTDIVRDAVIQRYEFTFELSWKTAKKMMGSSSVAPKVVIREMANEGLISDPKVWFDLLEARNLSSHTYKEDMAEKVYEIAKNSVSEFESFIKKLGEF